MVDKCHGKFAQTHTVYKPKNELYYQLDTGNGSEGGGRKACVTVGSSTVMKVPLW
jgi:hypothetical protein